MIHVTSPKTMEEGEQEKEAVELMGTVWFWGPLIKASAATTQVGLNCKHILLLIMSINYLHIMLTTTVNYKQNFSMNYYWK